MGRLTAYMVAGLMLVMVSGCESMPWKREAMPPVELLEETESEVQAETKVEPVKTPAPKPPEALQLSNNQRIKDVPLPAKAKEDLERSYIYESSNLQFGRMVYTIRASVNEVAQFYIDNAPDTGWHLDNVKQEEGSAALLFLKEGKKLDVLVSPLGMFRGQRLVLNLVPDSATGTNP
ncbi:MAG: hypothetical protein BWX80_01255 [Candidatus Hydrogenedentes bacterium ADurb.Bin101]|nr:MAG: hypothetical protein BWX80_01255 [Candidatus Hydrogenedentes bacterium ADurb.Bin101]HOC67660.1 hypothetical protein [Candidatus Hydrogenedentota bacterium]